MKAAFTVTCLLLAIGCKTSNQPNVSEVIPAPNPVVGTWVFEESGGAIHFLSTGRISIEPGHILASLNRFQNTQRTRYTSQLLKTGKYDLNNENELILYVTADWTGKGTGARRPVYKRVESTIIFEYDIVNQSTLRLKKKNLKQGTEDNLHSNEELELTLAFVE